MLLKPISLHVIQLRQTREHTHKQTHTHTHTHTHTRARARAHARTHAGRTHTQTEKTTPVEVFPFGKSFSIGVILYNVPNRIAF